MNDMTDLLHFANRLFSAPSNLEELRQKALKAHNDKRAIHDADPLTLSASMNDEAQKFAWKLASRPWKDVGQFKTPTDAHAWTNVIYCIDRGDMKKSDAELMEEVMSQM